MERDDALALLRSQHAFPGPFEFRVVVRPPDAPGTVTAMVAAAGPSGSLMEVSERKSRLGSYVALRIVLLVPDAEVVLDVYEVLKSVDGVLTTM